MIYLQRALSRVSHSTINACTAAAVRTDNWRGKRISCELDTRGLCHADHTGVCELFFFRGMSSERERELLTWIHLLEHELGRVERRGLNVTKEMAVKIHSLAQRSLKTSSCLISECSVFCNNPLSFIEFVLSLTHYCKTKEQKILLPLSYHHHHCQK